tara:strand:- start:77 stop:385 length:309 start_codon:yes stop_codon:yes gene_type:complete
MKKRNFKSKDHKEWRAQLMDRDVTCIVCDQGSYLNAHHLIPACKKYGEYEYDVDNGVMLCPSHHTLGLESAHKNPFWFYLWMKANRPLLLELALSRMLYHGV